MTASDVKEILDEAVRNTGVNHIQVKHRPRLLSHNGPCYISGELKKLSGETGYDSYTGSPVSYYVPGEDRTLSSTYEEHSQTSELLFPLGTGAGTLTVHRLLQQPSISRISKQRNSS
jgi:hypothetical protein